MRCRDAQLERLLVAEESSGDYRSIARHVEDCDRCQQRLLELSGGVQLQAEVRDTLRCGDETEQYRATGHSSVSIAIEAGAGDESGAECEPVSLDFLASPSHPEMLGRIGRYDVERMIGSGGMGIVLKGFDTELHRVVAIKVLKPHLAHIGAARHRFAREAQSAAAVVHEHVIPIYDVQSDSEMPFLVMQFVPGQSLQSRVDERGPLDAKEVLRIARQIAAGLTAAHAQGLVHRDVKPANILMEESVERILISDFGLARTVDDATLTRTGIVAGTPHYMSPEQASGQAVDHRSDLFSMGSVLYFMCTGRPPFRAEHALAVLHRICHDTHRPVEEVNPDVPAELAEVIDRLLAKLPADRYRNAHDVGLRIEAILVQLQQGKRSYRLGWHRRWIRWRSVVRNAALGMAAVVACLVIGMGLGGGFRKPGPLDHWPAAGLEPNKNELEREPGVAADIAAVNENNGAPERAMKLPSLFDSDEFDREFGEIQAAVTVLENRWKAELPGLPDRQELHDNWNVELDATRAALSTIGQRNSPQADNFQPVLPSTPALPSTIERIEP